MSKYAKINNDNIVENIIECHDSQIGTQEGIHIKVTDLTNDANIGHLYDAEKNKFVGLKPYNSWTLNDESVWVSPAGEKPEDGSFIWDEENAVWVELVPSAE
jgi:hypothetical protein